MSTVLITGGHGGIGVVTSRRLLSKGVTHLILAGRSLDKMQAAAQELSRDQAAKIELLSMDTSSLASVQKIGLEVTNRIEAGQMARLDALICNAGINLLMGKRVYSSDGYEMTFATNYLGHFHLTTQLLGSMSKNGRVVWTSSGTHDPDAADGRGVAGKLTADAIELANDGKPGHGSSSTATQRYSVSKLCVILFAYELHRRLRAQGSAIQSIAYDPGVVLGTDLGRSAPRIAQYILSSVVGTAIIRLMGATMGDLQFSGDSLADLALDPAFACGSGKYFQSNNLKLIERKSSTASYDEKSAQKLWSDSKKLIREALPSVEIAPERDWQ